MKNKCDRCGKEIDQSTNWGNCEICGDDLCDKCNTKWHEHTCDSCYVVITEFARGGE